MHKSFSTGAVRSFSATSLGGFFDKSTPASTFQVSGCGLASANGLYDRTPQQCYGADVYKKAGTSFVLLKRGDEGWSLVNCRGGGSYGWSLRSVELYRVDRMPSGQTPPLLGWQCVEGEAPAPTLAELKSQLLPLLTVPKLKDGLDVPALRTVARKSTRQSQRRPSMLLPPPQPECPLIIPRRTAPKLGGPAGMNATASMGGQDALTMIGDGGVLSTTNKARKDIAQSLLLYGKRGERIPTGTSTQFMLDFRVVLSRPSVRIPWGYEWQDEPFRKTGERILGQVLPGSPLERWNVWQTIAGRSGFCVQAGDQLIRTDGRWAFCENEVSFQDGVEASSALDSATHYEEHPAEDNWNHLVLEFIRPVFRPAAPKKPNLEVWQSQASLVISWEAPPPPMEPYEQVWGWALAIVDVDHELWYVVDGVTWATKLLSTYANDTGVIRPELNTLCVTAGVSPNRQYAACIALLTSQGWSSFSELSRPVSVLASAKLSDTILALDPKKDDWPERPRYCLPTLVLPGATTPIEIQPGPRDFLSQDRWIRMKVTVEDVSGLEVTEGVHGNVLIVQKVVTGSPLDKWNQTQDVVSIHGGCFNKALQTDDVIVFINGLSTAGAMKHELHRQPKPEQFVITFDRLCGGSTAYEDVESELFVLSPLDEKASKCVEETQWHVLMSQKEGSLCARIVSNDSEALHDELDSFEEALQERCGHLVYPSCREDADRRILIQNRLRAVFLGQSESRSSLSFPEDAKSSRMSFSEKVDTHDERVLVALQTAMADAAMDEDKLQMATKVFESTAKVVRASQAGQDLIRRAHALQALWKWLKGCHSAKTMLSEALKVSLSLEVDLQDEFGEFRDFSLREPPHDLELLDRAIKQAEAFSCEFRLEFYEARIVRARLDFWNRKYAVETRIRFIIMDKDNRQDDIVLSAALRQGEEMGVNRKLLSEGYDKVRQWKANHHKTALHDELFQAVKELRKHVEDRTKPGAGAHEQRRMRIAIAGSGLPTDDPLVVEAWQLLKRWEADNVALRSEARLLSAIKRVERGFQPSQPEAGELLGAAIAEVSQQGVDAKILDAARSALGSWQASRLVTARSELALAMKYQDQEYIKSSLELARIAGVPGDEIATAAKTLERLLMVDEVTRVLSAAMEDHELGRLERAIQTAHSSFFTEESMEMLRSGVLQAKLRFWTKEIQAASQANEPDHLHLILKQAEAICKASHEARTEIELRKLGGSSAAGNLGVAIRTLSRDIRALELVLPAAQDMSAVFVATADLQRVLLAVERYADQLPRVIQAGRLQLNKGIDRLLVEEAQKRKDMYDESVKALTRAIEQPSTKGVQLKDALIQARLSGAPQGLIERGFEKIYDKFPEQERYSKVELELMLAKQEADDISELSVESRFLRLQDASSQAKTLVPPLPQEIWPEIDGIYIALAAERSFVIAVQDAKAILDGRPLAPKEVAKCNENLKNGIEACRMSAQEEAKKAIPEAQTLRALLTKEETQREGMLSEVEAIAANRGSSIVDLTQCITRARKLGIPADLLEDAYCKLRKKKLDMVTTAVKAALLSGHEAMAIGLYLRGVALKAADERTGTEWRNGVIQGQIEKIQADAQIVRGEFRNESSGGSFGTSTWRRNPRYIIRPLPKPEGGPKRRMSGIGIKSQIRVNVAIAEAENDPTTLALHVVKNLDAVHNAGFKNMLIPGFEVLASFDPIDDLPECVFELSQSSTAPPVFIIPSAARGEFGPFTLVVKSSEPVEIIEVPHEEKEPRAFCKVVDLNWADKRPFSLAMGGGRTSAKAPLLSWYRNPQFQVRLTHPEAVEEDSTAYGPLLMAILTPQAGFAEVSPTAVHIVKNKANRAHQDGLVIENPAYHDVLACSGQAGAEYSTASEVGVGVHLDKTCAPVVVVPSLKTTSCIGKYSLTFLSTRDISVERLQ